MTKCLGCGALLQQEDPSKLGYSKNGTLCERCFRIKNYNEYKLVTGNQSKYLDIIKEIGKTDDLVLVVVDLFNIGDISFTKYLKNYVLVLNKRDLLPKSVKDNKLLDYFKYDNKIIISSNKNYNLDNLYEIIKQHKKVYLVGLTNAGKSTLVNKLLYNYSDNGTTITTSNLPSTTLNSIEIKLDKTTIIDTPGLIDEGNIINYLEGKDIKRIIPKREIKPITYQIKSKQSLIIDDLAQINCSRGNLTFFMGENLKITRKYDYEGKITGKISCIDASDCDVVINGLGFIKVAGSSELEIICHDQVEVYKRDSLI